MANPYEEPTNADDVVVGTGAGAFRKSDLSRTIGQFNVVEFGAKGDGVADDGMAFVEMFEKIKGTLVRTWNVAWGGDNNYVPTVEIIIPPGQYRIRESEALMQPFEGFGAVMGIHFRGGGKFNTSLFFDITPEGPDEAVLLKNDNQFLHVVFEDLSFVCDDPNTGFMHSHSLGIAQNYTFYSCAWGGTWDYVLKLTGTNTNSEMAFFGCNTNGTFRRAALLVPDSVTMEGDQFVNYNFYGHNHEGESSFCDMSYGGSINIFGGSFMMLEPDAPTSLFILRNGIHHSGACRFQANGLRIELRGMNAQLIDCDWGSGTVTFISCDTAVQSQLDDYTNVNTKFDFGNDSGPIVSWIGCSLQGKHQYEYSQNHYTRGSVVRYDGCEIWNFDKPNDFISIVNNSGIFTGGAPVISFRNSRGLAGSSQSLYIWNADLGANNRYAHSTEKKVLRLSAGWNGGLPNTNWPQTIQLPIGAVITLIRMELPAGSESSTAPGWEWTITDDNGVELFQVIPEEDNPSLGFSKSVDMFVPLDTDNKRTLTLAASAVVDGVDPSGYCFIEYYG